MQQQSIDITIFNSNKQRRLSNLWCELVPPCTPIAFVFVAILVCMFDWRNDPHAMFHSRKVHRIRYLFTHCAIMLFLICLLLNIYKDRRQKAVNECTNRTGIYVTDSHTEIASQCSFLRPNKLILVYSFKIVNSNDFIENSLNFLFFSCAVRNLLKLHRHKQKPYTIHNGGGLGNMHQLRWKCNHDLLCWALNLCATWKPEAKHSMAWYLFTIFATKMAVYGIHLKCCSLDFKIPYFSNYDMLQKRIHIEMCRFLWRRRMQY